ncbi:hypothetical protein Thimo_1983 [Thioflavicoccus mobilis 8321]|uniref:Pepco domain-containing protein n=1 Tax=Thioflavicoccus mobilis 8321 TaxID=765912 RepID=L0GVF9_9GAMM|nr:hypothetical protein [Thioflavicoccus mobilis]AGA90748.1 hypothetical protein Thimo_1983 [Thioflavicoccus mobilis 8321]
MGTIRVRVADDGGSSPGHAPETKAATRREIREQIFNLGTPHGPADTKTTTHREIREIFGRGASVIPFDTADLATSLRDLTAQLGELFGDLRAVGGYELQEVQVGLEISAEGGFNLIGSAKAGGKGAITLTFAPGCTDDGQDPT